MPWRHSFKRTEYSLTAYIFLMALNFEPYTRVNYTQQKLRMALGLVPMES